MDILEITLLGIPLIMYFLGFLAIVVFILLMYKKQKADDFIKDVLSKKLKELSTDNIKAKIILQASNENLRTIGNNMASLTIFGKMDVFETEENKETQLEEESKQTLIAQYTIMEIESYFVLSLTALYYFFLRQKKQRKFYLFFTYKVNEISQICKNNDYLVIFNELESAVVDNKFFLYDNKDAFNTYRHSLILDKAHLKEQETSVIGKIYADMLITSAEHIDIKQSQ